MTTQQAGRWQRSGREIVIDLEPSGFGNGYGYGRPAGDDYESKYEGEYELEGQVGPSGSSAPVPPPMTLDDARKQLRLFLKDMTTLKPWAWPSDPQAAAFVSAFTAALAHAETLAPRYAAAARAFRIGSRPSLPSARKDMWDFIEDMNALKEWADPQDPRRRAFLDAFTAARQMAVQAATRYQRFAGHP